MTEVALDQFNQSLRSSQFWRDWLRARGLNPDGPVKLTDQQRKQLQRDLAAIGVDSKGLEIDPAGNLNQNEGFGKQAKRWGPVVGGAALMAFGIPGVMPGMFAGGGAAAGGAAAGGAGAATGAGVASAAGPSVLSSILPTAIGAGSGLAGTILANRGQTRAAEAQEAAAREALGFEREQFNAENARLEPYRQMGQSAWADMGRRLGLQAPPPASAPQTASMSANPIDARAQGLRPFSMSPASTSRTARVRHPRTGEVREVPEWQVPALLQRGGQVVT